MKELNDKNFNDEIAKEKMVLVDFYATWCMPCSMQAEVLKKMTTSRTLEFDIVKVNVDEAPETALEYDVQSIPTMIIFKDNVPVKRIVGYTEEDELLAIIEEVKE